MSRKVARECAYKLVFEYLFNGSNTDETRTELLKDKPLTEADTTYIDAVLRGMEEHYGEIYAFVSEFTCNFNIERMFKPDLAVLILAVYEMKYMDDIPLSVSINEAVELIKNYSTEASSKYVNGVLGAIYKNLTGDKSNG